MRTTLDGREKILMSMRSGTVTGETPFFDEVPARSSIVAGTDCVVYAFSRDCVLHEILPNYPALTAGAAAAPGFQSHGVVQPVGEPEP